MKRKLIGIFVMTLLIATTVLPVVGTFNNNKTDLIGSPPVITVTDPVLKIIKVTTTSDVHIIGYVTDDIGINGFGYVIEFSDGTAIGPYSTVDPPVSYYSFHIHENVKLGANYLTIEVSDVDGNWATMDITILYIKSKDIYERGSLVSNPLTVSVSKIKQYINTPFLNFLENHPYMFPILRLLHGGIK